MYNVWIVSIVHVQKIAEHQNPGVCTKSRFNLTGVQAIVLFCLVTRKMSNSFSEGRISHTVVFAIRCLKLHLHDRKCQMFAEHEIRTKVCIY